jgi:ribosome-associated protein
MDAEEEIRITGGLSIPRAEISFTFSRSRGPGGQNVNKVSTRATLHFDVARSPSLGEGQRAALMRNLATRITKDGVLRVSSQKHRTQSGNREAAIERFASLIREALAVRRRRRPTKPTEAARLLRLEHKRRRGRVKDGRRRPAADD